MSARDETAPRVRPRPGRRGWLPIHLSLERALSLDWHHVEREHTARGVVDARQSFLVIRDPEESDGPDDAGWVCVPVGVETIFKLARDVARGLDDRDATIIRHGIAAGEREYPQRLAYAVVPADDIVGMLPNRRGGEYVFFVLWRRKFLPNPTGGGYEAAAEMGGRAVPRRGHKAGVARPGERAFLEGEEPTAIPTAAARRLPGT